VEFLVDQNRNFYFLEMNTRLQVEHPVTEMVVGIDLVKEQLRIAAGERLRWRQEDVRLHGAALECRIYAEDPANNFFPSPGLIRRLQAPRGPGVRSDSGVYEGWTVPLEYDPLLAKLVVWGNDRAEAVARLRRALREYEVFGIETTIPFFRRVVDHPDFVAGQIDTGFIDRALAEGILSEDEPSRELERVALLAAALDASRHSTAPLGPSGRESAWKAAGRDALLNRWPTRGTWRRPSESG
jgi:acetyl-CoA carboxylase biotin carboxylase subunit